VMRKRGRPEYEAKDLLMDFNGIQVTIAVAAQAMIDGRIDCKTAGRLAVDLQRMAKLLRIYHRSKNLPLINTDNTDKKSRIRAEHLREKTQETLAAARAVLPQFCANEHRLVRVWAANEHENARIDTKILEFKPDCRWSTGPPLLVRAA